MKYEIFRTLSTYLYIKYLNTGNHMAYLTITAVYATFFIFAKSLMLV